MAVCGPFFHTNNLFLGNNYGIERALGGISAETAELCFCADYGERDRETFSLSSETKMLYY